MSSTNEKKECLIFKVYTIDTIGDTSIERLIKQYKRLSDVRLYLRDYTSLTHKYKFRITKSTVIETESIIIDTPQMKDFNEIVDTLK